MCACLCVCLRVRMYAFVCLYLIVCALIRACIQSLSAIELKDSRNSTEVQISLSSLSDLQMDFLCGQIKFDPSPQSFHKSDTKQTQKQARIKTGLRIHWHTRTRPCTQIPLMRLIAPLSV